MTHRRRRMLGRRGNCSRRRPAFAAVWLLVALLVLLVAMAVAINAGWLGHAHQQLHTAADAAALAAARELVSDEWLRAPPNQLTSLLTNASARASEYAGLNPVLGQPLALQIDDSPFSDVGYGTLDPLAPSTLVPIAQGDPSSWTLDTLDTVMVFAPRLRTRGTPIPLLLGGLTLRPTQDLRAVAIARLDRDVYGFRAGTSTAIPLVPLGIRSDPGAGPASWEHEVRDRAGPDDWSVDPATGSVSSGADRIPEIVVELQLQPSGDPTASNGYLLTIGAGTLTSQITAGISRDDLAATAGTLALDAANQLALPGAALAPADGSLSLQLLRDQLTLLQQAGQPRVWPLVSQFDTASGTAVVTGFVAARVVAVETPAGGPLRIRLQPAQMVVAQALTDAAHRSAASFIPSPYLARLRLAR